MRLIFNMYIFRYLKESTMIKATHWNVNISSNTGCQGCIGHIY